MDPYRPQDDNASPPPPERRSTTGFPVFAAPATAMPRTDFVSLAGKNIGKLRYKARWTWTDMLLDAMTPFMILIMVYTVVMFLLDVRYVYTAKHDENLRFVSLAFILGVVALNRLIARDGASESILYMAGLAGAIGMYTFVTTGAYDVGPVVRNFMNSNPYLATGFNMCIVAFLWWLTNRLMHECCVDENKTAGDTGILTGAARRVQAAFQRDPNAKPREKRRPRAPQDSSVFLMQDLEPFDPVEGYKPKTPPSKPAGAALSDRLSRKHPGISIFFFSVPVMLAFIVGLRVVQRGGEAMVRAGEFYMGVYAVTALMLLMLTSLGGLRQYFRARNVAMPENIGWFWIGLGIVMIAVVLAAAVQLPMPGLPGAAYIGGHEYDPWSRYNLVESSAGEFKLSVFTATPMEILYQSRVTDYIGKGALVLLGLFLVYLGLKAIGGLAARIARQRDRYPRAVVAFFDGVEGLVARLTRLPALPKRKRRVRVQRAVAASAGYQNPMADPARGARMGAGGQVEYAYEALCALAQDLGVPRAADQTPFEFAKALPEELRAIREEALELTQLYVKAAYSPLETDAATLDRLRKFWLTYNRVRNRAVR